jgi:hypothetical protein
MESGGVLGSENPIHIIVGVLQTVPLHYPNIEVIL